MPGTIAQELLRILSAKKAQGITTAWLSPQNSNAFFFAMPKANQLGPAPVVQPRPPIAASQQPAPAMPQSSAPPPQAQPSMFSTPASVPVQPAAGSVVPISASTVPGDWDGLRQACLSCQACPLFAGRRNMVFEDGCRQAHVMFIGEGPGEDEDRQGVPFVGRAGQLLTRMINAMGLDRTLQDPAHGCYIANIVKCRPPANRNPEPEEGNACIHYLKRQIELVNPKAIILLGAVPLNFLMGRKGITAARGKWLKYGDIPVMPTFHPAYLLRFERTPDKFREEKLKVWSDLLQVMAMLGLERPQKRQG